MKTLWFKQIYVAGILSGEKTDTIRKTTCKVRAGETIAFTVGPRPPFAVAKIIEREEIDPEVLPPERRNTVRQLYGPDPCCRLRFQLLPNS